MDNSKINLNEIYTEKEIQDIKKIIPTMSTLIMSNIGKLNKYPNIAFSSNEKTKEGNSNQYIEKNKFIELILEKAQLIFKEENNIILTKSISYILEEIQKHLDNTNINKQFEANKLSKNKLGQNLNENIEFNKQDNFNKISHNKKLILNKHIYLDTNHSPSIFNKNKSNEILPISARYKRNKKYNNSTNNSYTSIKHHKYIDFEKESDYKIKSIKGNSIINNFITFTNSNQTENNINNITNELGALSSRLSPKTNKVYSFYNILQCKRANFLRKKNNNNTVKILLPPNFLNQTQFKSRYLKGQISPINNIKSKILLNSHKKNEKLFHHKYNLTEIDLQSNLKNDNNYLSNYIRKKQKLKTENNVSNSNYNKKSLRKSKKSTKTNKNSNNSINKALKSEIKVNNSIPDYSKIEEKDFDIFDFDNNVGKQNTLTLIGNYIFVKFSLNTIIKKDKFNNWCKKLTEGYTRKNPYHSDLHAADITQTCLIYLQYGKIKEKLNLSKISICSLILSCLCHDYKHPGLNNNFLKETKNELAIRYNDVSILENMHISEAFKLINYFEDCNIFSGVEPNIYKQIRKEMISCVLSTDMINHSKQLDIMKKYIEDHKNNENNPKDNQNFIDIFIHSADVSNPTKPFPIYLKWAKLIVEEFCQQGDKEKALGMHCTCDRKTLVLNLYQISFIDNVIEPYVSLFVTIFPDLKFLHDNIKENRDKFLNYSTNSDVERSSNRILKINKKNNSTSGIIKIKEK